MAFFAIRVLPRVLIPWLWLGAFATTDEHTRESATDVPADPPGRARSVRPSGDGWLVLYAAGYDAAASHGCTR